MYKTQYLLASLVLLSACGVGINIQGPDFSIENGDNSKIALMCGQDALLCPKDIIQNDAGNLIIDKNNKNFFLELANYKDHKTSGFVRNSNKQKKTTCKELKEISDKYDVYIFAGFKSNVEGWLKSFCEDHKITVKDKRCKDKDTPDKSLDCKTSNENLVRVEFYKKAQVSIDPPSNSTGDNNASKQINNNLNEKPKATEQETKSEKKAESDEQVNKGKSAKSNKRTTKEKRVKAKPKYEIIKDYFKWMLVYDISTESALSTKNTVGDILKESPLNVKLGALVFSAGVNMFKNGKQTAMELHARQPATQHANLTSSALALKKKQRLIKKQKVNSLIYIGPDALATSKEQLAELKPIRSALKRIYLIVDENGCKKAKLEYKLAKKKDLKRYFKKIRKRKNRKPTISCVKEAELSKILNSLPNDAKVRIK